ncbi:TIGR02234 family membrane protein [Kitasatospora sp. NPDC051853]|uniref:TIGR02234 family membrane protein n=1 Tax=Kitasatospora sp. NPDC051853 TaxID=3364058 RepID=UPI0037A2158C
MTTELPSPRTAEPVETAAPSPKGRRMLGVMLGCTVVGAVLVLTAVSRVWAEGTAGGQLAVEATGSAVSGLPGGLALVGLASAVAVFAVRGVGKLVVGALLTLAGLGAAVAAVLGATDSAALHAAAAGKLALVSASAEQVSHTAWPWVAFAGGLLLAVAGALTIRHGRSWPAMGSRYEAPARKAAPKTKGSGTPADIWQALDRGEDPTA